MYESVGYETYAESELLKMVKKVNFSAEGSINRGFEPLNMKICRV
jgi:hypothetical protein